MRKTGRRKEEKQTNADRKSERALDGREMSTAEHADH